MDDIYRRVCYLSAVLGPTHPETVVARALRDAAELALLEAVRRFTSGGPNVPPGEA